MANKEVGNAYAEARKKHQAAVKAFHNADNRLISASNAWTDARIERNKSLPDGFYVEADAESIFDDFPIYAKVGGEWYWKGRYSDGFEAPDWTDGDGFDIDVIPINDFKFYNEL